MVAVDGGRKERWVQSHWATGLKLFVRYSLQVDAECCDEIVAERA